MGADIKSLRTRIKSVDSTLHLTKAMGLVASSKIRRATLAMNKAREYQKALVSALEDITASPECAKSPYTLRRDTKRVRLVVIAGDRGLAGGYNANIFRLVRDLGQVDRIIPIGKRACDRYKGSHNSAERFTVEEGFEIAEELCRDFVNGEYDELAIVRTKYVSVMTQEAELFPLLPIARPEGAREQGTLFEPDPLTVLDAMVREYVAGMICASVRESFASEVAARRCAMDSAGKNAQQMIDTLQLSYNRARQGAITQEITEIVAGSGE